MNRSYSVPILMVVAGIVLSVALLGAQISTSGLIRGTVTDPQGAILPGVTVIAFSEAAIGGQKTVISNAEGKYRFPALTPGVYSVEAQLQIRRHLRDHDQRLHHLAKRRILVLRR